MTNSVAIRDYTNFEDLKVKAGYRTYTPKIGSLGQAIMTASKKNKCAKWCKEHLDTLFDKLRQNRKKNGLQKQNSGHSIQ